jgi:2-methylisocitrate lyase-like PEP mutase family enzyme
MPTAREKRLRLRELMAQPELIVAPSSFNPLSACLVESVGFPAVHVSGSAANRFHAYSDLGLLGMTEMVALHERIAEATSVPVIGDAEAGFGGVLHTVRSVRAYERAGLAAIHLEDEIVPKDPDPHAHSVIPTPQMVEKLRAALDARTDPAFVIIARSNARSSESFNQVMERASAYAETGVDAIWPGVSAKEELPDLTRSIRIPMVGVPRRAQVSLKEYGEYGFKIACIPGILGQAATCAMGELLEVFKRSGSDEEFWKMHPQAQRWRQWFNGLGQEQEEAILRRAKAKEPT